MADTNEPENIYAPGGPTNDTEPTSVDQPNQEAVTLAEPTTDAQTDPYDSSYNNPELSTEQVGVNQVGTVIPLNTISMPQPVNLTDLTDLTTAMMNNITNPSNAPKSLQNKWFQGLSMILHMGPESYAFTRINLPYPQYLTFTQIQTIGQNILNQIQSNPTEFLIHYESQGKQQTLLTEMMLSQVTGITLVGYEFDWMDPNTPPPVYT